MSLLAGPLLASFLVFSCGYAQNILKINANVPDIKIDSGKIQAGGRNMKQESISLNSFYFYLNGKPFIPITGEFHFSRYPVAYWEESIKKMKAGGINAIATYVFWSLHEEHEGHFNWKENRDLRRFVEICAKNGMMVIVRIGPFCHGEIRNGALPDWLLGKPLAIRSNDPRYLFYVERLYREIGNQLAGLYFKEGGPIIGVQLENEMQHSASPWGLTYPGQPYDWTAADRDLSATHAGVSISTNKTQFEQEGNDHMRTLKSFALKAGIDVPLYTATGWGFAAQIPYETLPVTAAYPYPGWTDKPEPSDLYLYKDLHNHPDYQPVRYSAPEYPVFSAEIGVGIMSTYTRRPVVPPYSTDALINRFLGSGANGIGYYMYHGGSTPKGDFYFNDEAYGYPKISYDFQAPIGEFGEIRPSFHRLKLLHFFINDFAEVLAPMQTVLPDNSDSVSANDTKNVRYAVREKNGSGFLFVNNFQDHLKTQNQTDLRFEINTANGKVTIPEKGSFTLQQDENLILPFNLDINGAKLNYATAQLLLKGNDAAKPFYVFFCPEQTTPEFSFAKTKDIAIQSKTNCKSEKSRKRIIVKADSSLAEFCIKIKGTTTRVLVIGKQWAEKAFLVNIYGSRHLVFSDALVLQNVSGIDLTSDTVSYAFSVYPKLSGSIKIDRGMVASVPCQLFSCYSIHLPSKIVDIPIQKRGDKYVTVTLPTQLPDGVNDIFLKIDYVGDTGMGFINNDLVTDEFYKGMPWIVGLKRFIAKENKEMTFYFRPIYKNAPFLIDLDKSALPALSKMGTGVTLKNICVIPEYQISVLFKK